MHVQLNYGRSQIPLDLSRLENASIIKGGSMSPLSNLSSEVSLKLQQPTGKHRLADEIKQKNAQKVLIVINDITRPTPYGDILPPLLEELHEAVFPLKV